jgi:hypothetical protein
VEASSFGVNRPVKEGSADYQPDQVDLAERGSSLKTAAVVAAVILFPVGLAWAAVNACQRHYQHHLIFAAITRSLTPSGVLTGIDLSQIDKITNIAMALLSSKPQQIVINKKSQVTLSSGCIAARYELDSSFMIKLSNSRVIIVPCFSLGEGGTKKAFPAVEVGSHKISQKVIVFPANKQEGSLPYFHESQRREREKAVMVQAIADSEANCFLGPAEEVGVDGQIFFISERFDCDLQRISQLMNQAQLVSDYPRLVLFSMIRTLTGLVALFKKGVVHSDIKPENIFINYFGTKDPVSKIADFESVVNMEEKKALVQSEKTRLAIEHSIEALIEKLKANLGFSELFKGTPSNDDYYPGKKEYYTFLLSKGKMTDGRYCEILSAFKEKNEGDLTPVDDFERFMIFLFQLDYSLISGTEDHISPRYARERFPTIESDMYALGETLSRLQVDMALKHVSLSGISANERLRKISDELKSSRYTTVEQAESLLLEFEEMLQSHLGKRVLSIKRVSSSIEFSSAS